jgi:hypothetical protein
MVVNPFSNLEDNYFYLGFEPKIKNYHENRVLDSWT